GGSRIGSSRSFARFSGLARAGEGVVGSLLERGLVHIVMFGALAVLTLASAAGATATLSTGIAFTHVAVVPMDRELVLEDFTLIVRDDRIVAIGPADSLEIPTGATRVDGRGKYLMPGIIENHAHIPGEQDPAANEIMALYALTGATTVRAMMGTPF